MTMIPVKFKSVVRDTILALTLVAAVLCPVSTMAQEAPSFSFNLGIARGGGPVNFGTTNGLPDQMAPQRQTGTPHVTRCLTNREIRRGVAANGYDRVEINRDLPDDRVEVAGRNGNWLYSMRVDKCSGQVDRIERVRPAQGRGFGLQFN